MDRIQMKKKDQVSSFFAEELLYDYLNSDIPAERAQALEAFLQAHPHLLTKFEHLKAAQADLKIIERVEIPDEWIKELALPHPSLAQQLVSLERKWSPQFWRSFPYAVVGVAVVMAFAIGKPWQWVNLKDVEVTHVSLVDDPYLADAPDIDIHEEKAVAVPSSPTLTKLAKEGTAPSKNSAPTESSSKTQEFVSVVEESSSTSKKPATGILYRSTLEVDNLDLATEQTIEKIKDLNGRKAGQVELGWNRDEGERYFHFSLPESNKDSLIRFLSNFGRVQLSSQEHPLVMPQGKIRIILIVKQKELSGTPKAATSNSTAPSNQESGSGETRDGGSSEQPAEQ